MQPLIDSQALSLEGSVDTATTNEQVGKNLTKWLDLIQMAVSPLENPQDSVIDAYWNQGRRPDGRAFSESRPYRIQHGALTPSSATIYGNSSSDVVGSAMVQMGHSSSYSSIVLASVTTQVGQPAVEAPKQGDVLVAVSCCNGFGSCNDHSLLTMQTFLQRILEENMDLEQLALLEGKAAYRLMINISILQDESPTLSMTLVDVCLAAAVSALLDTKLPVQPLIQDGIVYAYESMYGVETKSLNMPIVPCSLTAIRWHRETDKRENNGECVWIVDPDLSEQQVQEPCATIVVNAKSSPSDTSLPQESLLSVHFSPSASTSPSISATKGVTAKDISQVIHLAVGHAEAFYPILQGPSQQSSFVN